MKTETGYNIGDKVWAMLCDEPTFCTIEGICIMHTKYRRIEEYCLVPNDGSVYSFHVMHNKLFPTKEELLKSLECKELL